MSYIYQDRESNQGKYKQRLNIGLVYRLKIHLHYDKNCSKPVGFKEPKNIFHLKNLVKHCFAIV
jgi:hypothetical protein